MKKQKKQRELKWQKLDNTANLFPVIASENMTNVYRISVVLKEEVRPELLQQALEKILPWFDSMNVCLRTGVFWYYFETNRRPAPLVEEETTFPCRYIMPHTNRRYLFRVTYFGSRINLEVFHVLADGMGGINFLKELTYQYLRLAHPAICETREDRLSQDISLDTEDSYLKNYKRSQPKGYAQKAAVHVTGEKLYGSQFGVIHGEMKVSELKKASKKRGITINEYLAGVYAYSIYKESLGGMPSKKPIVICVPVNLRPFFDSMTNRNFFAMVSASFLPEEENYTLDEVIEIIAKSLRNQINKEHLEKLFSYNVSNQKNLVLRAVPLVIKKLAMKFVYNASAKATTTTLTNIGCMEVDSVYEPYIEKFHSMLAVSKGQNIKGTICSYKDKLILTFSSVLRDVSVQKRFFRTIAGDEVSVVIESNGVYYE